MATAQETAEEVRRRMAEIRSQLHHEMSGVVGGASSAVDWRSYVRGHPWPSLGIAFAAGYFLVPRRSAPSIPPVPIRAAVDVGHGPSRSGSRAWSLFRLLGAAAGFLGPLVMRIAQAYVVREVEDFLAVRPGGHPPGTPSQSRPGPASSQAGGRGANRADAAVRRAWGPEATDGSS